MKSNIFEKVLNDVSLDPRIPNGTFDIFENGHMDILREYLSNKGIDEKIVKEYCNKVIEGKHPQRQAYNAKGILVTFPTPEYKQNALKRGTHFEKDPTAKAPNVFGDEAPQPDQSSTQNPPAATTPTDLKTSLPLSKTAAEPADNKDTTVPPDATTTAAPQQSSIEAKPTGPAPEPTELPVPPVKSDIEKQVNKDTIKAMLKGDDYMLECVVSWLSENAPVHLIEQFKNWQKNNL